MANFMQYVIRDCYRMMFDSRRADKMKTLGPNEIRKMHSISPEMKVVADVALSDPYQESETCFYCRSYCHDKDCTYTAAVNICMELAK